MNAFQILDKDNNAIPINTLDEEICELWGVEVSKKSYARPYPREHFKNTPGGDYQYATQSNWYDTLGWMIAQGKTFEGIISYYKEEVFQEYLGKKDTDGTILTLEVIIPHKMKVLNFWIEQGYIPKQIKQ